MIGLDTTVLLTHEIQEAAGHETLRAHIHTAVLSGDVPFALAPQVLQEFVHVATDPRRFKVPLTMEQALEQSRFWWESAEVVQCHPGGKKGQSRVLSLFSLFAHNALQRVCGTPAFNSLAIHAIVIDKQNKQ